MNRPDNTAAGPAGLQAKTGTALFALLLAACNTRYQIRVGPTQTEVTTAWSTLLLDGAIIASLVLAGVFARRIKKFLPREEVPEARANDYPVAGIAAFLLAAILALLRLYPHAAYLVRLDTDGVRARTGSQRFDVPWKEMTAVRNNWNREVPTARGTAVSPRLEFVGSHDETLYIEKQTLGGPVYEGLTKEAGRLYFSRPQLTDQGAEPAEKEN